MEGVAGRKCAGLEEAELVWLLVVQHDEEVGFF